MPDIDQILRESGARWRASQAPPPVPPSVETRLAKTRPSPRRTGSAWLLAPAVAAAVAVGALVFITQRDSGTEVTTATTPGATVPIAKPPLLRTFPASTGAFQVAAGNEGGSWSMWVKITPLGTPATSQANRAGPGSVIGPGLGMQIFTPAANGGVGGDPTQMASLVWETFGPLAGFPSEVIYGVTSTPAAHIRITFTGRTAPVIAPTYTSAVFSPLRFYAVAVPASAAGEGVVAEALAADGSPLVRTNPNLNGPPVPGQSETPVPGTVAMWPLADSAPGLRNTAEAAATDFAVQALGIAKPVVRTISSTPNSPAAVAILLPASNSTVKVLAQPTPDGRNWELIGFLDAAAYGITYGAGHWSVQLHVPANTDSVQVTVVSDGTIERVPVDQAEIDAGTAILPVHSIQALLVVYKNAQGQTVGVGGGVY